MCPVCETALVGFELGGVEIDSCVDCGGVWLDAGELELIAQMAGVDHKDLSRVLHAAKRGPHHGSRRCPRCLSKLERVWVGETDSIELDRCRKGHGLWLDRGEMESFIHSFDVGEEGAVARFLADFLGKQRSSKESDEARTEPEGAAH